MYQAGTLSGNSLAMAAGIATLNILLNSTDLYDKLTEQAARLIAALKDQAARAGVSFQAVSVGAMFGFFFTDKPVTDYQSALSSDTKAFSVYFHSMLEQGVYLAPSQFEAGFVSAAHTEEDFEKTINASGQAFDKVAKYVKERG